MIKQKAQLESLIGERVGHLVVDADCPTHYIKQMLSQFLMFIENLEKQNASQAVPAEAPAAPAAEVVPAEPTA